MVALSLNKNVLFKRVYSRGKSIVDPFVVMYFLPNRKGVNRLGITVSKKIGGAVVRSRARRLIKEAFRLQEDKFSLGYDLVFVARGRMVGTGLAKIMTSMERIAKKGGLMQ